MARKAIILDELDDTWAAREQPCRPRADAQRNHMLLIGAAWTLLADRMVDDFNMEDVARIAGLSRVTVYRHFPTRDALIEAMLRVGAERFSARLREQIPPEADAVTKLRAFVQLVFDVYEEREFNVNLVMNLPDAVRIERQAHHFGEFRERLRGTIAQGQREGVLRPVNLDYAVQAVLAIISPVTLKQQIEECGWSRDDLQAHVADMVVAALSV